MRRHILLFLLTINCIFSLPLNAQEFDWDKSEAELQKEIESKKDELHQTEHKLWQVRNDYNKLPPPHTHNDLSVGECQFCRLDREISWLEGSVNFLRGRIDQLKSSLDGVRERKKIERKSAIAAEQAKKQAEDKAKKDADEKKAREAAERDKRETAEREAREAAERDKRETAEREAREAAERAKKEAERRAQEEKIKRALDKHEATARVKTENYIDYLKEVLENHEDNIAMTSPSNIMNDQRNRFGGNFSVVQNAGSNTVNNNNSARSAADIFGSVVTVQDDYIPLRVIPVNEKKLAKFLEKIDWSTEPKVPMISTGEYIAWIRQQFKMVSGYDIDYSSSSYDRNKQQNEAFRYYREFEAKLLKDAKKKIDNYLSQIEKSPEKKEIDMSILALDSYGNDDKGYLYKTDYRIVDINKLSKDDPIRTLASKIDFFNATNSETGFNAVLYHNEKTGEYTIAFKGSSLPGFGKSSKETLASKISPSVDFDMKRNEYVVNALGLEMRIPKDLWNDWVKNNGVQGAGGMASQFIMANEIGKLIDSSDALKKLNINFTGHSLGGGLASVAGLATGKPTYTYNAEGVSDKILDKLGLLTKKQQKQYDIIAYHTDNDILTNAQKMVQGQGNNSMVKVGEKLGIKGVTSYALRQMEKMGYDTKVAKTLSDVVNTVGISDLLYVAANVIDPGNTKNNYVATATGEEVPLGDLNTPDIKIKSGVVGIVAGGVGFLVTRDLGKSFNYSKDAAKITDAFFAHRMEPMVDALMLKDVVSQNLWQFFNKEKNAIDKQIDKTRLHTLE